MSTEVCATLTTHLVDSALVAFLTLSALAAPRVPTGVAAEAALAVTIAPARTVVLLRLVRILLSKADERPSFSARKGVCPPVGTAAGTARAVRV